MTTARVLLLCALFWAPIPLGSNREWSALLLAALLTVSAVFLAIALLRHGRQALPGRVPAWLLLVPVLLVLGSLGGFLRYSDLVAPGQQISHFLQTLGLASACVVVLYGFNDRAWLRRLMLVVVVAGVAQALYGGVMVLSGTEQILFLDKTRHLGSATGTFLSRNNYAGWLAMCLALGIGLMLAQLDQDSASGRAAARRWLDALLGAKARLRLMLVVMVIGLVLSRSRMGNTAFLLAMSLGAVLALLLARRAPRSHLLLFGSLLVVDMVVVGAFFGIDSVVERLQRSSLDGENRDEVVRDALVLVQAQPWLGWGQGAWGLIFPGVRSSDVSSWYSHAHNDYIEVLVDGGILALTAWGSAVLLAFAGAVRALRRSSPLRRGLGFAGIMAILCGLIHATVDFNFQIPANALLFVVIMACSLVAGFANSGGEGRKSRKRPKNGDRRHKTRPMHVFRCMRVTFLGATLRAGHWDDCPNLFVCNKFRHGVPMQAGSLRVSVGLVCLGCAGLAHAGAQLSAVKVNDGVFLTPSLTVEQRYDDNIFQSDNDEEDSMITTLKPVAVLVAQRENSEFRLGYGGEYGFFWDSGDDDYDDHIVRGDFSFSGSRTTLDLYAYYEYEHEDRGTGVSNGIGGNVGRTNVLTRVFDEPIEYTVQRVNGKFGMGTDSSRVRAVLGYDAFSKQYENFRSLTRDRDRDVSEPSFSLEFGPTSKTRFDVGISQRDIEYDRVPSSGISLDSEETRYTVGVTWRATGATTGKVKIGGVDKEYDDNRRNDFSGLVVDAEVIWSPLSYSQVVFGLVKGPRETDGQGDAIDVTTFSTGWNHDWNDRFTSKVGLVVTNEEYEGNSRDDDFTRFNLGFEYDFRRAISVGGGWNISNRDSSQANTDFDRNVVYLSLTAGL